MRDGWLELPGAAPEPLVRELDEALKQEINRRIASDHYSEACLLSELKSKFLYAPMSEVHRKNRGRGPGRPTASSYDEVGKEPSRCECYPPASRNSPPGVRLDCRQVGHSSLRSPQDPWTA